ncbi:glucokinase [Phormidium yuhuli AB48]|uniref:Glucokinase n=1 Tax=Phormidium yuhuli AB48 TaxID=2940671 RepID=A0ABY5AJV8_9CYAN|nr:glucokinase [Phormidium yuhuli]USR89459.1 glucokinase [Phormidium yuhuli AB48]
MSIVLAGDIGGTKTILRLVEVTQHPDHPQLKVLHEDTYPSQDYPDLVPIAASFLKDADYSDPVQRACFGIAGPVVNNTSQLTNLSWSLEGTRLAQELEIESVTLINDFAAIGYGVLGLEEGNLHRLQEVDPAQKQRRDVPLAVLGAGTGLGECFLISCGSQTYVGATEGGHSDFAPRTALEFELLDYLKTSQGLGRVSVERVVSGQGIVSIYEFLCDRHFADHENCRQMLAAETPAAAISQAALEESDEIAQKTMEMFVSAYGAEAGNLALKLLPYRGLYIAGGIAAKILPLLHRHETFMNAYLDKGRVSPLLKEIPVEVVLEPKVGLIGAAICADLNS